MNEFLAAIFDAQDQLITRSQSLQILTEEALRHRLGRIWKVILPGIYASSLAPLTQRQRARAALLFAGESAWLTDSTLLRLAGLPYLPDDHMVRVAVPDEVQRASKDFVAIRRTKRPPDLVRVAGFPAAPLDRALCEFVARHDEWRDAFAVMAAAVQLRRTDVEALYDEAIAGPSRGRARILKAIDALRAGVRSLPEYDFRELTLGRRDLPEPLWNCLIELPNGKLYSPDGFIIESATAHEVEGREYHDPEKAGQASFEKTLRRTADYVEAGINIIGSTPRRIRTDGHALMDQFASLHKRNKGRGLPPGVRILRYGPPGTPMGAAPLGQSRVDRDQSTPAA